MADADDLETFDCGVPSLNEWLSHRARHNEGSGASRTFLAIDPETSRVAGYYCLVASSLSAESAPGNLRRNMPTPIPVILLGRLAVDMQFQGRGVGVALLRDAFARCVVAARCIGAAALTVHALDERAAAFYAKFGFNPMPGASAGEMYIRMSVAEASVLAHRQGLH